MLCSCTHMATVGVKGLMSSVQVVIVDVNQVELSSSCQFALTVVNNSLYRYMSLYDHITSVLQELQWLPIQLWVDFKIVISHPGLPVTVWHGSSLAADCQLVSNDGRQLRSATLRTFVVRRTYSNYGDRCFAAAGPKMWNSLPADLWQVDISFQRFKRLPICCHPSSTILYPPHYKSPTAVLDMHHLTCGISSLLHSVNLILFTVLLVHLILCISPHHSHITLTICHSLDFSLQSPDLKLISFTNSFLHSLSRSFWIAFTDLKLYQT